VRLVWILRIFWLVIEHTLKSECACRLCNIDKHESRVRRELKRRCIYIYPIFLIGYSRPLNIYIRNFCSDSHQ
jgi:hypothetical protein